MSAVLAPTLVEIEEKPRWRDGTLKPSAAGTVYERLTVFGVDLDWWDGKVWRRLTRNTHTGERYGGVICANQDLPWRPLAELMEHGGDESHCG